jgi:hypothetical protein
MAIDSSNEGGLDVPDLETVPAAVIDSSTVPMNTPKLEDEPEVEGLANTAEFEPDFEGALDGDPYEFEDLEAVEAITQMGMFAPMASEASYCKFANGDAECDGVGIRELFMWTPPHYEGEQVKTKLVIYDSDRKFAVLRERESALEIKQFRDLVAICGIHPNALPRNIH